MSALSRLLAAFLLFPVLLGPLASFDARAEEVAPAPQQVEVVVDRGYKPNRVVVTEGRPVRLTFIRREYTPCTREVVFPSLNIRRELPPNQPVVIDLPAMRVGEVEFHCGMNMVRGKLVVEPSSKGG